jgi:hypothetical protein
MSEYHKIETLYERDLKTHKVHPGVFKNRVYEIIKTWHWTEKIDGTNIRCIWQPAVKGVNVDGVNGDITESVRFGGKTDNAQMHGDLVNWLRENVTVEKLRAVFPDTEAVIYGEGYGAGIQKGGIYGPTKRLIVFDVLVGSKWWLSWENTCDVAGKLGLDVVPYVGEMTLEDATEYVRKGFRTQLGAQEGPAEGLVGRTVEPLFDKKGARLIVKLKTKDF